MLRGFPVRIERSAANDEFLHQIYDLSLGADRWYHITSKLCSAAGADSAILFRLAHGSEPPVFFGVANGHDRSALDAYSQRYHLVDELADFAETLLPPPHIPFTAKEVLGADTLSKSEWYQDFIKTQGYGSIGSILLSPAGGDVGRLGFTYLRASGGRDFSAEDVADIVDLSASEAQLAAALTAGRTLADHADETGTSINTVRWMLKQVFAKTQTNSQRDLVRLVLRSPAGGLSTRNGS